MYNDLQYIRVWEHLIVFHLGVTIMFEHGLLQLHLGVLSVSISLVGRA